MSLASGSARWSTPTDIVAYLRRLWNRGHLLVPPSGEPLFPLRIPLHGPRPSELAEHYTEVQTWIASLQHAERSRPGHGYELMFRTAGARLVGANQLPDAAIIPTCDDAIALVGRQAEKARWQAALDQASIQCLPLLPWMIDHPLLVVEHAEKWERLLAVISWLMAHPRPGVYLRQVDLPGVDTKFIETHRSLLRRMLDAVMSEDVIQDTDDFVPRYGFRAKPRLLRFRFLDPRLSINGLTDLSAPVEQLATLDQAVCRIIITENELNGLAFPPVPDALVLFGLGFGVEHLVEIPWIRRSEVWYWGDIDTHGFAILDQVRNLLPQTQSFLMDVPTLMAHRDQWVVEPAQERRPLSRLTHV